MFNSTRAQQWATLSALREAISWVAVGTAVVGGVVSYASADKQADAMKEAGKADPRFNALLWGEGDHKGLLPNMQQWYEQNQSGLNPQMRQGMNDQWGVLTDPNLRAGYNNMSNLGASLMGAPVAGNPFSDGRASLARPWSPTQMAPGLLSSAVQPSGPPPGAALQPMPPSMLQPVNFGGGAAPGAPATPAPGPFSAPPPPPPAPPPAPAAGSNLDDVDMAELMARIADYNRLIGPPAG